jgi:cytochrome bd-type quinol oxidase subunit 1
MSKYAHIYGRAFAIAIALVYLVFAFILQEINPSKWTDHNRAGMVFASILAIAFAIIPAFMIVEELQETKKKQRP